MLKVRAKVVVSGMNSSKEFISCDDSDVYVVKPGVRFSNESDHQ